MYAPSVAPSATGSVYSKRFRLGANLSGPGRGGDDLDASRRPSFENAVFGVLFTLSKENSETRIVIRWVLLKILLDGWQVFTTVINPSQGWKINENGTAWKIVSVLSFSWVADLGYGAYVGMLYGMVALLAANIGLCVWVAWCFKEQKFPVVWPIKVLRFFTSVFFQAFDVASLNLLQVGITCQLAGPKKPHKHLMLFPSQSCASMPHVVHAVVSGVSLMVFVALALLTNMSEVEVNPKSRRPMAMGHSGAEVMGFALKVCMTLVDVFLGWPNVAACVYLGLSLALTYQYMRWSPSLVGWVNHLKAGVSIAMVWCSANLVLLVFHPGVKDARMDGFQRAMTVVMLAGIGPTLAAGYGLSVYLMRRTARLAAAAITTAAAKGVPLQDIVEELWADPRDVEIAARCCRVWVDRNLLDKDAVARAQLYIKAGQAVFPGNAFVSLLQANFMIDVLGVAQSGSRQVEAARKLKPGIMSRFIIFVRMQQAQQKAAGSNAGGVVGSNMDLLGFVEYQRKQRMVVRLHREALTAMCNFWKALDAHHVSFTYLSKALAVIEVSVTRAQTAYHLVLETYGNNYRLVRLYGKFLETVKNDPWGALEYYTEADRLEQEKNDDGAGPLLPDGTPLSRMDDLATAVLLISSIGEIQMANKQLHHLFGYKKGELDGKLITMLLAPQSGKRMIQCLATLVEQSMLGLGQTVAMVSDGHGGPHSTTTAAVLGMHHERMAFPLRITITKATGVGEDSTFIALLEPVHVAKDASYFWVAPNGVIAGCDPQFVANFGFLPHDVIGSHLGDFVVCDGDFQALRNHVASVSMASAIDRWELDEGDDSEEHQPVGESVTILHSIIHSTEGGRACPCHVSHRYSHPLACEAAGRKLDLGDAVLYEIRICRASPDPFLMLVADKRGAIKFTSPQLTSILCPRGSNAPGGHLNNEQADAFKDRTDSAHKGAGHGLAILSGVAAAHGLIGGYNLKDFLPHPWKDTHNKLLKDTASPAGGSRSLWSCTRQMGKGASMELHDAHGQKFLMHVAVSSAETVGEHLHIIRMAHSTMETAVSERRLRLHVNSKGIITSVNKDTPCQQLFGFEASHVVGRPLWEVVDGVEQQLLDRPGSSLGRVTGQGQGSATAFSAMLERVIRAPGRSWRVAVVPPTHSAGFGSAATRANAELAAAQRAAQIRAAVMTVHIPLLSDDEDDNEGPVGGSIDGADPAASVGGVSGADLTAAAVAAGGGEAAKDAAADPRVDDSETVTVDLWPVHSVSGVLELNSLGRITSVLEEHTRPAGLLFGVGTKSLVGQSLTALVPLPAGREEVGDLLSAGSRNKKSSLKQTAKDPTVKVGPVHVLQAIHTDGHPLQLAVQVVGKPGSGEPLTVLLRLHITPMVPSGSGAAAATAAVTSHGPATGLDGGRLPLDSPLVLPKPAAASKAGDRKLVRMGSDDDTPSIREMEEFVTGRSMNARSAAPAGAEKVAAVAATLLGGASSGALASGQSGPASASRVLEKSGTAARMPTPPAGGGGGRASATGFASGSQRYVASPLVRPVTPSTPVKSPAELLTAHANCSDNSNGPGSGTANGNGTAGSAAAPPPPPPPMPAALAGLDLPLPGVVSTLAGGAAAASRVASARREVVLREAGPPKRAGESTGGPPAAAICSSSVPVTLATPADDDSAIEGSAGVKCSASSKGEQSDDPDAVQPVASPKNLKRIQEWVATKGELFQNEKPRRDESFQLRGGRAAGAKVTATDDGDEDEGGSEEDTEERGPPGGAPIRAPAVMGGGGGAVRLGPANASSWGAAAGGLEAGGGGGGGGGGGLKDRRMSFNSPQSAGLPMGLFAPPQPAYPPLAGDFDDNASNGGQSVMSGNSGGTSSGAEYKRGKRFRNLIKLMDSSEAEAVLRRFRWGSLITMAVLAAAHTVCFALVVVSIKGQQQSFTQLMTAGRTLRHLHESLVSLRAMDQIYKGKAPPHLYNVTDVEDFANFMYDSAMEVKELNNYVANNNWEKGAIRSLYYLHTLPAWLRTNVTTGEDIYANITLWDMATKVYTTSKDVYQNYKNWSSAAVDISSTPSGRFLFRSAPDFNGGFRLILDDLLSIAVRNTSQVNDLLMAFLVLEGCGITVMAAAALAYLLRKLALQRYTLYGTFLVIPVGLTRALSSQLANTTLLEEEDDEDDDDEEGPHGDEDNDKSGMSEGETATNVGTNYGAARAASIRKRHATLEPSVTMNSRRRPSFQAAVLAAYAKTAAETQSAGLPPGAAAGGGGDGAVGSPPGGGGMTRSGSVNQRGGSRGQQPALQLPWRDRLIYRLHLWCACLARRSRSVFPASLHGHGHGVVEHHHKRHLRLDSHDTTRLLFPFVLWSCLVVTFYTVSVVQLKTSKPLVAIASVSNFNAARTYRAIFYAQELAAEENVTMLAPRRDALRTAAVKLRDAFYTLQLGSEAWQTLGLETERFPLVSLGMAYETPTLHRLFYTNTDCLRSAPHLPCPGPEYQWFQLTHTGVDSMMQVFLSHLFAMVDEVTDVSPGLANHHLDFVYNVGTRDLTDANIRIGSEHYDHIKKLFSDILLLHILLFVLLWFFLAGFYVMLLKPLLLRLAREKRHIAELLSQLPLELDVEKMVRAALAGNSGNGSGGHGGGNHPGGDMAAQAGAAGQQAVVTDAARAWKSVLRSTSNAISQERERRSSVLVTSKLIQ